MRIEIFAAIPVILIDNNINLFSVLLLSAAVHRKSRQYLNDLAKKQDGVINRQARIFLASLKPFGVQASPIKVLKHLHVLIFYMQVSNAFISVLFAFPG